MADSDFSIPVSIRPGQKGRPEGWHDGAYYARANSGPFGPFWLGPFRQLVDAETAAKAELKRFHPAGLAECVFTSVDVGKRYWNKPANRWRLFVESSFTEVYPVPAQPIEDDLLPVPAERVFFGKLWSQNSPVYVSKGVVSLISGPLYWRAAKQGYGRFSDLPTVIMQNANQGASNSYADKTFLPGTNPSPFFDMYINRPPTDLPNDVGGEGQYLSHAEVKIISVDRWVEVYPIARRTEYVPGGISPITTVQSWNPFNQSAAPPFVDHASTLATGGTPVNYHVELLDGARIVHADFKRTFLLDNTTRVEFELFESLDAYPASKKNGIEVDGSPEGLSTLDRQIQDIAFPDYPAQRFNFGPNGALPAQQNVITCNLEVRAVYVDRRGGSEYFLSSDPLLCSVSVMPAIFRASPKQMPAVQLPIPPQPANFPLHGDYIRRTNEGESDRPFPYRSVIDNKPLGPQYTTSGAFLKVVLDSTFRQLVTSYVSTVFYGGVVKYKDYISDPRKDHTFGYSQPQAGQVHYEGDLTYSFAEESFTRSEQQPGVQFPFRILPYGYPVTVTEAFDSFSADPSAYPAHELGPVWTRWHGGVKRIVGAFENDSSLDYPYISTDGALWDTVIYGKASGDPQLGSGGDPAPPPAPAPTLLYKGGIKIWIVPANQVKRIVYDNTTTEGGQGGSALWREVADDGTVFYIGYGDQSFPMKTPGAVIVGFEHETVFTSTPGGNDPETHAIYADPVFANGPYRMCLNCDEDSTTQQIGGTNITAVEPNPNNVLTVGATGGPEVQKFATIRRQTVNGEIALTLYRVPQKKGIIP